MTETVSAVKAHFGKVVDQALEGKPTIVARRGRFVIIQAFPAGEPIPDRPPGSFLHLYQAEEIDRENRLAEDCTRSPEIE
jgi:hypothetical protein